MHKLGFDTETGGLDPQKHTLLTAYFGVYDAELKLIDELYLQLKPENVADINVTPDAMKINKINLDEHLADPNTVTYAVGKDKLVRMLEKNKIPRKRKSFQPMAHNINFDYGFVWGQLMPKEEWEKLVHYRALDTSQVCSFLKDVGILPADLGNLTSLVEYFKIPMQTAHNAKDDVNMMIMVYKYIVDMMKQFKAEKAIQSTNIDLLKIIEI